MTPQEVKQAIDANRPLAIVDVREPFEHAVARIEGAELIPMNTVPERVEEIRAKAAAAPVIVICHHGVRSLNVVHWLRRQGIENTWSMAGGIDLWSLAIDPAVPRY